MSRSAVRVEMEEEVRMRGISIRRKMIDESKTHMVFVSWAYS
jgi:hypothetical protein